MSQKNLEIIDVAYGGAGIARDDGKVYFVDDTVPGDLVEIQVVRDHERYAEARPIKRLQDSPLRNPSPCIYSDRCGGCQWHGISYEQQLKWKSQFIASAMQRIGGMGDWSAVEVIGAHEQLNYRNRIHLKGRIRNDGSLVLGYFARGSRDFIPVEQCLIADKRINELLRQLSKQKFKGIPAQPFKVEIQVTTGLLLTIFPENPGRIAELQPLKSALEDKDAVAWCGFMKQSKHADYYLYDQWDGLDFYTQPGLFQQVNVSHNHTLRTMISDIASRLQISRILDVYCGSGNLTLPLSRFADYVEGVEFSSAAIRCAKFTAEQNQIEHIKFVAGDGVAHLWKCARAQESFDLVVVDPPREGLHKGVNPIQVMLPEHVIYVSCDPTTLARDLGRLVRKGYEIQSLQGLDFFPNTYHVETVAYLRHLK